MRYLVFMFLVIGGYMLALHFWGDQFMFRPDLSGVPTEDQHAQVQQQAADVAEQMQTGELPKEPVEEEPVHFVEY